MIRENHMVRDGGPPMKVAVIDHGVAECVFYDSNGIPRLRYVPIERLQPMWQSLQPRSLWPEISQGDQIASEREERLAADAKEAERRASKKQRRSRKIKRRRAVPA